MKTIVITVLLLTVVIPICSAIQPTHVNVNLEPREINLGDPIDMTITIGLPPEVIIVWPEEVELSPAQIISREPAISADGSQTMHYLISLYELGEIIIPEVPIAYYETQGDTIADTTWIDLGEIEVTPLLGDSVQDIHDIRPPEKLAWRLRDILPYILIAVGLGLIGGLIYWLQRKFKPKPTEYKWTEKLPDPDDLALIRLKVLQQDWKDGKVTLEELYSETSDILKVYMGGMFRFQAAALTTRELFKYRELWNAVSREHADKLKEILDLTDRVRFAGLKPNNDDDLNESAKSIVRETRHYKDNIVEEESDDVPI